MFVTEMTMVINRVIGAKCTWLETPTIFVELKCPYNQCESELQLGPETN